MVGDDYLDNDDDDFIDEWCGNEDEDENLQKEKMMKNKDDIESTCTENYVQNFIVRWIRVGFLIFFFITWL